MLCVILAIATFSPRFCTLEENLRKADVIVFGRIAAIVVPRPELDARYELRVERAYRGVARPGDTIVVAMRHDWTCESRRQEYQVGEQTLLFLSREDGRLSPYCGFQSEYVVDQGIFRASHVPVGWEYEVASFLDGLGDIVKFVAVPRASTPDAWLALLDHPNHEVARFALLRVNEVDLMAGDPIAPIDCDDVPAFAPEKKLALFHRVVAFLAHDVDGLRSAARGAVIRLWCHCDLPLAAKADRDSAVATLLEQYHAWTTNERYRAAAAAAELRAPEAFEPLLAMLDAPDHDVHERAFDALRSLRECCPVRSRRVLDRLAVHAANTPCERGLGQRAVAIVNDNHPETIDTHGVAVDDYAKVFRAWWIEHRHEIPE